MSVFLTTTANTATVAALSRFHNNNTKSGHHHHSARRQLSSSFTDKQANTPFLLSSSPAVSNKPVMTHDTLNKGLHQDDTTLAPHDPSQQPQPSSSHSSTSAAESTNLFTASSSMFVDRAHQYPGEGLDRINRVPSTLDHRRHHGNDSDIPIGQTQEDVPAICTGRSRSNTLTSIGAVDVAEASISDHVDHVMRPRRPSLANRPSGLIHPTPVPVAPTIVLLPDTIPLSNNTTTTRASTGSYPPMPLLPQYHDVEEKSGIQTSVSSSSSSSLSSAPCINLKLGFLPRIAILIGLFGLSLGGLYLLAQVLPPLSLPKSINDVKVDAEILQEFATATYEGWIRTFWVFSVVYMWKQCFGIPGSAFLNILAGALYGPWFGTLLTSLLTTLGSVLAYFMSFFLMEPIMNRYASGRLDQMRLQIQKKALRSSSVKKPNAQDPSATSTAVQPSIRTLISNGASTTAPASVSSSSSPSVQRGVLLRTHSSSFTVRKTDQIEQQEMSFVYSKTPLTTAIAAPAYQNGHDESEIQESKGLLSEEMNVESCMPSSICHQDAAEEGAHTFVTVEEEDEDDQDDSEGTSLFMQLLLIRLFPLTPYWFINLASPLVGVPVVPFMTSMFLGCMPYNYICAQAGAILSEIHELRDIYQQPWILFQIVVVLLLSTVAVLISKRTKKRQSEKEQQQQQHKSRSSEEEEEELTSDETTHRLLRSTFEDVIRHRHSVDTLQNNIVMSSIDFNQGSAIIDMTVDH